MRLGLKYTIYTIAAVIGINLTIGVFLFWGIGPLLDQIDVHMSANFSPAARLNPVITDNRPLLLLSFAAVAILSLLFVVIQLLMFHLHVMRPLKRAANQATAVARGDFSALTDDGRGEAVEIMELVRAVHFIRDRMQNYVNRLQAVRLKEHEAIQQAEQRPAHNSDLLNDIALELKNELNTVNGFAQLLRRGIEQRHDSDTIRRQCRNVLESSDALNVFAEKLLRLSHLECGRYILSRDQIRTMDFLQTLDGAYRRHAEMRNIALTCHYSPEQPDVLICDREMLFNGFGLLLAGIIRTSPVGSEVSYGCIGSGTKVIFWLKAPPCEKMFLSLAALYRKNFMNAVSLRSEQLAGSLMLNLMVAKASLEIVHGVISVLGPDENGSEFMISFNAEDVIPGPAGESAGIHTASNLKSSVSTQRPRILPTGPVASEEIRKLRGVWLSGDDRSTLLLSEIFRQAGHILVTAPDENVCRQEIAEAGVDVLIIDQDPQLRTLVLLKELRETTLSGKKPYTIVVAPFLDGSERRNLLRAGVDECWVKPIDIELVFARLRQLSQGESNNV